MVTGFAIVLAGRAASSLPAMTGVVRSSTAVLAALMALPGPRDGAPDGAGRRPMAAGPDAVRTACTAHPRQGASHGQIMTRLRLARNTVKKYAAADRPEQLIHGPILVAPFREYLRRRREREPDLPIWTLLQEMTLTPAGSTNSNGPTEGVVNKTK
ncbi:hypothetical protein [Microbispora bryophytorum]|nr:hypothetical protein [Microbispora bryophytorum]